MRTPIKLFPTEQKIGAGAVLLLAGSLLVACGSEAGAHQTTAGSLEPAQAAVTTEPRILTMAECRALADRDEKISCMTAARDALRAENSDLERELEAERETGRQLDATNEVLRVVRDVSGEATQEETDK